jgi:hypothetical protein
MDLAFFGQIPVIDPKMVVNLKFNDFYRDRPVSLNVINNNRDLNLNLNFLTYLRVTGSCRAFVSSLKNNRPNNGTCLDLKDFLGSFKRGSASIRKTITGNSYSTKSLLQQQSVRTFTRLINAEECTEIQIKNMITLWGEVTLPNPFREFLYKFYNNCLGINTRLSHFVQGRGRGCTFCTLNNVANTPDETFLHIFYGCNTVQSVHNSFTARYFIDINLDDGPKRMFWYGILPSGLPEKNLFMYTILLVQFGIWRAKLKNKLPSFTKIENEVFFSLATIYAIKRSFFSNDQSTLLSRNFLEYVRQGFH